MIIALRFVFELISLTVFVTAIGLTCIVVGG